MRQKLQPTRYGVALTAAFLCSLLIRAWLARHRVAPVWQEDGMGYLAAARFLSGSEYTHTVGPMGFYSVGYAFPLVPIFWFARTASTVFTWVLVANAIMTSAIVLPLARFVRDLAPRTDLVAVAGVAFVAANYTAFTLRANYIFADNLWTLNFALLLVAVSRYLHTRKVPWLATGALLAVATYTTHPRGAAVVAASAVAAWYGAWRHIVPRWHAALATGTLLAGTAATVMLNYLVRTRVYVDVVSRLDSRLRRGILEPQQWGEIATRGLGQVWYLLLASFGIALLGALFLWRKARRSGSDERRHLAQFTVLTVALVGGVSAASLVGAGRYDHLFYGRYLEGVLAPVLAVGLAWALSDPRRAGRTLLAGAGVSFVLALFLSWVWVGTPRFDGTQAPINMLGLLEIEQLTGQRHLIGQTAGAALVTLSLAVTVRLAGPRTFLILVGLVWFGTASLTESTELRAFDAQFETRYRMTDIITQVPDLGVIAVDTAAVGATVSNWYGYALPRTHVVTYQGTKQPPPAEIVIARAEPPAEGARILATDRNGVAVTWVLPGPLQDQLSARGWLLPRDQAGGLPLEALVTSVELLTPLPAELPAGAAIELEVAVEHRGTGAPWVPFWYLPGQPGTVRPFVVWRPRDGLKVLRLIPIELDGTLYPGQGTQLPFSSTTMDKPGDYDLWVLFHQGEIGWFPSGTGFKVAEIRMTP